MYISFPGGIFPIALYLIYLYFSYHHGIDRNSRDGIDRISNGNSGDKRQYNGDNTNTDSNDSINHLPPPPEKVIKIEDEDEDEEESRDSTDNNKEEEHSIQTPEVRLQHVATNNRNLKHQLFDTSRQENVNLPNHADSSLISHSRTNTPSSVLNTYNTPPQSAPQHHTYNSPSQSVSPNDDIYGKMIASELSQLPQHLKVLAKQELSNVLFKYQIQASIPATLTPAHVQSQSYATQSAIYPTVASVHSNSIS